MAYFRQKNDAQDERAWADDPAAYDEAYDDDYDDYDDEFDDELEEYLTEAEFRENRRYRFRMAAGLIDFLSVVAGAVVILIMGALLVNMITWLQSDFDQMFTLLRRNL